MIGATHGEAKKPTTSGRPCGQYATRCPPEISGMLPAVDEGRLDPQEALGQHASYDPLAAGHRELTKPLWVSGQESSVTRPQRSVKVQTADLAQPITIHGAAPQRPKCPSSAAAPSRQGSHNADNLYGVTPGSLADHHRLLKELQRRATRIALD